MRIVRPQTPGPVDSPAIDRLGLDRIHYTPGRPQWLRDWIADKGDYVELKCGHKENVNDRSTLSILQRVFGEKQLHVFCERCNEFRLVAKSLGMREYLGIKPVENSAEPLF